MIDVFNKKSNRALSYTDDIESKMLLKCYPSIANDKLELEWFADRANIEILIYDIVGNTWKTMKNVKYTNKVSLDVSKYNNGLYFVKLIDKDKGISKMSKFVKQ